VKVLILFNINFAAGNLQPNVGKSQLSAPYNFLTHDASGAFSLLSIVQVQ